MHVAAQHVFNHLVIVVTERQHEGTDAKSLMVFWHFRLYLLTGFLSGMNPIADRLQLHICRYSQDTQTAHRAGALRDGCIQVLSRPVDEAECNESAPHDVSACNLWPALQPLIADDLQQ